MTGHDDLLIVVLHLGVAGLLGRYIGPFAVVAYAVSYYFFQVIP